MSGMKEASLGAYSADIAAALAELERDSVPARIWQKDHTVWKPDPTEITNRLGWLDVADLMAGRIGELERFADEVRTADFRHVVLLGMGGSSLGAEVLWRTFGRASGRPDLIVLDSTIPETVAAVTNAIDPATTIFLLSSKSGTTIEVELLFRYFRELVRKAVGERRTGEHFVFITDPGTPFATLAGKESAYPPFLNPTDIGGRYSVLSCFGLVPGALIGVDLRRLLASADRMRQACAPDVAPAQNPSVWWGACLGALQRRGRDKMTLITSPALASFGLWVEQLIAESLGKEGRGIVPVVGEPLVAPGCYGDDRLFVYLRLATDEAAVAAATTDAAAAALKTAGYPVVVQELADCYELGAEFFRWEFATAVAGAMLKVNPFFQPDVQRAKEATQQVLRVRVGSGSWPEQEGGVSPKELLSGVNKGAYFAIMAYLPQTPAIDAALQELRRRVVEKHGLATTLGYGPRFLHSTGQLHKGGPNTGVFLQITADHGADVPIPGEPYTFGVVADAQALGDLKTLRGLGRRVAAIRLPRADAAAVTRLAKELLWW